MYDLRECPDYPSYGYSGRQNAVAIAVAPDGSVWIATEQGVGRYAGDEATWYTAADGLAHDAVGDIVVGPAGALWFATARGISSFDGEEWRTFASAEGPPTRQVAAVVRGPDGAMWFLGWDASVGLNYVDGATQALVERLLRQELVVAEAVAETMQKEGPDPDFRAVLQYYPLANARKTLRQLLAE